MMIKRKLDGAVDESSGKLCDCIYITRANSGGLHLVKLGLMVGWQAVRQMKFGQGLKACCRSKY